MELTKIMNKHGSDKGSGHHNYTEFYDVLFSDIRNKNIKLLEIGIGTINPLIPSSMAGTPGNYIPGASLRGWSEYFSKGDIQGCDIDKTILFSDERISTFYLDQTDEKSIQKIKDKYNIIIDDGLHHLPINWQVMKLLYNNLENNGYYIIEDVMHFDEKYFQDDFVVEEKKKNTIFEYVSLPNTKNNVDNNLIVIRKGRPSVIITNTIHVSKPERSCFSSEQRFTQLLNTISSVREKIPNCYVILVEMSNISDLMKIALESLCDKLIFCTDDNHIQHYSWIAKSYGEAYQILRGLEYIPNNTNIIYKISGRYFLDNFSEDIIDKNKFNFVCNYNEWNKTDVCQTTFYSIPISEKEEMKNILNICIQKMYEASSDIEFELYQNISKDKINIIKKMGCKGWYSPNGIEYEC